MENTNTEFKVFGKNIESVSIYYGIFLMLWGVVISFLAKSSSFTSYIPSYLGLIIFIFSVFSVKFPTKKKLFMHIAALFGFVTFIGGLDLIRLIMRNILFDNIWADLSKIMMLTTGVFFLILCFKSFRHARKIASDQQN